MGSLGPYFVKLQNGVIMTNVELFNYLKWCLLNVEKSNSIYINTRTKFWKRQLIQDVLLYVRALDKAKKQIPETASCFPEFLVNKRGEQITVYTIYFSLIL